MTEPSNPFPPGHPDRQEHTSEPEPSTAPAPPLQGIALWWTSGHWRRAGLVAGAVALLAVGVAAGSALGGPSEPPAPAAQAATPSAAPSPSPGSLLTAQQRAGGKAGFDSAWVNLPDTDRVAVCAHIDTYGLQQSMHDFNVEQKYIDDGYLPSLYVDACETLNNPGPAPAMPAAPAPRPAPALTDQERAFVDAHQGEFDFDPPKPDAELVAWARERCTVMTEERSEDRPEFLAQRWRGGAASAQNMRVVAQTFCPDLLPDMDLSDRGFNHGNYIAVAGHTGSTIPELTDTPGQIAPGTYSTVSSGVEDCYWERMSASGSTIANDFLSFVPGNVTVTINSGEGFTSSGCGFWVPA